MCNYLPREPGQGLLHKDSIPGARPRQQRARGRDGPSREARLLQGMRAHSRREIRITTCFWIVGEGQEYMNTVKHEHSENMQIPHTEQRWSSKTMAPH